jgi:hypothetical protein
MSIRRILVAVALAAWTGENIRRFVKGMVPLGEDMPPLPATLRWRAAVSVLQGRPTMFGMQAQGPLEIKQSHTTIMGCRFLAPPDAKPIRLADLDDERLRRAAWPTPPADAWKGVHWIGGDERPSEYRQGVDTWDGDEEEHDSHLIAYWHAFADGGGHYRIKDGDIVTADRDPNQLIEFRCGPMPESIGIPSVEGDHWSYGFGPGWVDD